MSTKAQRCREEASSAQKLQVISYGWLVPQLGGGLRRSSIGRQGPDRGRLCASLRSWNFNLKVMEKH